MAFASPRTMTPVIQEDEQTRSAFLIRVYQHLGLAVAAFIVFETFLFMTGIAEGLYNFLAGASSAWLLVLGAFMVVNVMTDRAANNIQSTGVQYAGLFGLAAAEALIFAPFLYYVFNTDGAGTVGAAAFVTLVGFAGLTAVAMLTKSDLSFLRPFVMFGGIMALVGIVGSVIFGFHLGVWFSVAMVALAGAAILYQTQNIVRQYPAWAHVGAAVRLFGSLMTMFWYVLRIFSDR